MKIRIAITIVVAGAAAFACSGPRTRSEASSAPIPTSTVVTAQLASNVTATQAAPSRIRHVNTANGSLEHAAIDTRFAVSVGASTVRFALDVKNASPRHLEVNFKNGQTYDFVVVDTVGRVLWRWSAGRMFTQSVQNKQLGKGDVMHIEESWDRPPKVGKFTAIAVLNSVNYPAQRKVQFAIPAPATSLASR